MSSFMPAVLGAYHGLNPAMGWLFAVALGLQERRAVAVLRALPPIALGHALSVAIVVALFSGAALVMPANVLRIGAAGLIFAFAAFLLFSRKTHPRWVGMRIGFRELVLWSFLMSSAHGAGLMLLPLLARARVAPDAPMPAHSHVHTIDATLGFAPSMGVLWLHSAAMFIAMACVALAVFQFLGVNFLRRAWVNLDVVWVSALFVAGVVTLVT